MWPGASQRMSSRKVHKSVPLVRGWDNVSLRTSCQLEVGAADRCWLRRVRS